jgi:hypothetical protein
MVLFLFYKITMIIGSKKFKSYALILLFSFFSAFALNVTLIDLNAVCIEESIVSSNEDSHVDSPQNSFLFLDEIHHEEVVIYAPVIFYTSFNSKSSSYINPYLNCPHIPPRV